MKIAKSNNTLLQTTSQGIIDHYYHVPNNYDFETNNADDVTNVDTLQILMSIGRYDYSVFRDSLRDILVPQWNDLSTDDRKKCVGYYRYPANISDNEWQSYYTELEHETNWSVVVVRTREVRLTRLFAAFQKISYRLAEAQVALIYMQVKDFCYDYYYADLPHILLWIQNGALPALGIDFSTTGFAQVNGYTTSLRDELLDIFINGNYIMT